MKRLMKLLIFLLTLLFEMKSTASSKCGIAGCNCNITVVSEQQVSRKDLIVNCRAQKLKTIPSVQFGMMGWKAAKVDFGRNLIHSIPSNAFIKQIDLKELILDENYIEDVNIASFNVTKIANNKWVSPLKYIDLRDNHLHHFPLCFGLTNSSIAPLDNLETLLIGGNLFGANLEMESFAGIRNLKLLDISRCLVRVVSDLTFKKLTRLEYLDLSQNNIHEMSHMIFAQEVPLHALKLHQNQLTKFPQNLPLSLEELDLSSNYIDRLHKKDYKNVKHLRNLKILDLSGNKITYLIPHFFSKLTKLLYLDISYNLLEVIEEETFHGLQNLEILGLNNNQGLVKIAELSFSALPRLTHLFLQQCRLQTLFLKEHKAESKRMFHPLLKNLWLFGNPLSCDCYMLPLVKLVKNNNVWLDATTECILLGLEDSSLSKKLEKKLSKSNKPSSVTMCTKPLNRHHRVVGIPLLNVSESYFICPDEPFYIIVSCFLGIIAFMGIIPVVFILIHTYLCILRFVQAHLGIEKEKED